MKKLYKYLLIGLLSITFTPISSFSQNIDSNRMNRDINIMENILSELFRAAPSTSDISNGRVTVIGASSMYRTNSVRGAYLKDFGVIFMVSKPASRGALRISQDGSSNNYSFYYNNNGESSDESSAIDQESVTNRIKEFLKDYGSTIGQLKNNEKVMVIYGSNSGSEMVFATFPGGQNRVSQERKSTLPVISVSAKVSDLADYRSGKLSAADFDKRTETATSEDKEYLDLKVMSNIFETALKDQEGASFRIFGGVNHIMLDNFGALFSFDVRHNSENSRWASNLTREFARMQNGFDKEKEDEEYVDYLEKITASFESLKTNLKEYIVDYGRTVKSVSSDQFMLLSVDVNGRYENIPGRIDIQVKKSVLEQLDKGSISREQALERVVITEY